MPQRHFRFSRYSWINNPSGGSPFRSFDLPPRQHHHLAVVVDFLKRFLTQIWLRGLRCSHRCILVQSWEFSVLFMSKKATQYPLFKYILFEIKAHFVCLQHLCTPYCRGVTLCRDKALQVFTCSRWFPLSSVKSPGVMFVSRFKVSAVLRQMSCCLSHYPNSGLR